MGSPSRLTYVLLQRGLLETIRSFGQGNDSSGPALQAVGGILAVGSVTWPTRSPRFTSATEVWPNLSASLSLHSVSHHTKLRRLFLKEDKMYLLMDLLIYPVFPKHLTKPS